MTESETVALLCELLYTHEPFVHVRFGDGDVMFMSGNGSKITGDGEEFSAKLQSRLLEAWEDLACIQQLLLGDLRTYAVSDGCEADWDMLLALAQFEEATFVHMEALRVGFGYALPFYEAVKSDDRDKLFVGPERLEPVAERLGCDFLPVPLRVAHEKAGIRAEAIAHRNPGVLLVAAGRGGKIIQSIIGCARPEMTQIDIGSGLDLLIPDGVRRGTDLNVNRSKVLAQYRTIGLVG